MLQVKNVTKRYGSFLAVDNISFEIKDNEIIGFLGPNGAGKSTTMNMITGYIEPTKGKIIVNGKDIAKEPNKVKKQIGYMPESVPLYQELTVREFVNYMADLKYVKRKDKKAEVDKVLNQVGIDKVQNKLIKKLSRGYKQRVSLAGALIGNPEILILDEPTVGLDPKQITEIRELIKSLGKKHTVILSSHILSEVSQICEKVIIINKGKILAIDTPKNLEEQFKEKNSIYVTVEDKEEKLEKVTNKIAGIKEIRKTRANQNGSIEYLLIAEDGVDLRKEIFESFPKNNINIVELKNVESTLEDAFLKLINDKEEEIKTQIEEEEIKKKKRDAELEKMNKEERKKAIKEDKKIEKQRKKEAFDKEWEEDKKLAKEEKERVKAEKDELKEKNKKIKKDKKEKTKKEGGKK